MIFIINKQKKEEMKFGTAALCLLAATASAEQTSKFRWGYSRHYLSGFCKGSGAKLSHADINGDGKADIICDDNKGRHYIRLRGNEAHRLINLGLVK